MDAGLAEAGVVAGVGSDVSVRASDQENQQDLQWRRECCGFIVQASTVRFTSRKDQSPPPGLPFHDNSNSESNHA